MKKYFLLALLFIGFSTSLLADPPVPPVGKRWVINETFSDEFNGTKLDDTKWYDYHPKWIGRAPGIFLPSQVSVSDGYMKIKGEKLKKDTLVKAYGREITFTIAGGAVISKSNDAFYGYYECKFKAAKTTMSTTFWLSTDQSSKGPNGCDTYGLELDIQECIGREGDFNGKYFAKGMNSNSHFWYNSCDKERQDLRAPQSKIETKTLPSEDFYTYGGWWHDASKVSYYLDDRIVKTVDFYSDIKKKPFDNPMHVNMVSETYPFPWISLPTDEELADPAKNTCYYDWVRAYNLVDVDKKTKASTYSHQQLFNENIYFTEKPKKLSAKEKLELEFVYQANQDRQLLVKVFDKKKKAVLSSTQKILSGFGRKIIHLNIDKKLKNKKDYTIRIFVKELNGKKTFSTDEFNFSYTNN
ncbi:family 16 glycosylhydrolase [Flavicella sediminum]|uniref:family 16 glycosylhydrolase n=1 Tax=Flavicella sediminum TaxID=2585141 RepID=UPI001120D6F7|nr:family 16 glycosylhydrolase [Flavicella sediminum]